MPALQRSRLSNPNIDSIVCHLCRRAFRAITFTHLVRKHDYDPEHPIRRYLRRFRVPYSKCQDTIERGREAFIEFLDRHGRRWTAPRVIAEIRARAQRGLQLNFGAIRGTLTDVGRAHYGSWDGALLAAGVNPRDVRRWSGWSRPKVIEALQAMNPPVSMQRLKRTNGPLCAAIYRYFPNSAVARRAAGLPTLPRVAPNKKWTREAIARAIRERTHRGEPMDSHTIQQESHGFYQACWREYGGWPKAVIAAGCGTALPTQHFTPGEIAEMLRRIKAEHGKVTYALLDTARRPNHAHPFQSVRKHYGTLDRALAAARVDRHAQPPWTKELVTEAIRALARQRKPLHCAGVLPRVWHASRKFFPNWDAALESAGVDPTAVRLARTWTPDALVAAIRAERKAGRPLNAKAVETRDCGLYGAAVKQWGSWDKALEAAGVDPRGVRLARRWTRELVVLAIRAERDADRPLNCRAVYERDQGLLCAAISRCGSWDNALRAAGIDPEQVRLR